MAYFGVDTDVRINEINHEFKNKIRQKKLDADMGLFAVRCAMS